jgi:hypothetical protein
VEPPAALGVDLSAGRRPEAFDPLEDRRRMQQNLAALAVVVVLVLLGAWMIERLRIYSRTMACIESGHRNCLRLEITEPPK